MTIATLTAPTGRWRSFEVARDERIDEVRESIVGQRYVSMERIDVTVERALAGLVASEKGVQGFQARAVVNKRRRAAGPVAV